MASSQNKLEVDVAGLPGLAKGLQRLRNDEKFCDFVIECSGVQFAVHRVVLCSKSEYFEKMCGGEFKEAGKGNAKLVDEDPEGVSRMLDFMYGLEYLPKLTYPSSASPPRTGSPPRGQSAKTERYRYRDKQERDRYFKRASTSPTSAHQNHALIHAQMYAMGEKYLIPDLKKYAESSFSESIRHVSAASMCEVITEVYASTPESDRGLRDKVLDTAIKNLKEMLPNTEFKKIALETVPQFGYELLQSIFGAVSEEDL